MPFPTDFPQAAVLEIVKGKNADLAHVVLAGYELLGFGLYAYFGDVKFPATGDFETLSKLAESAEVAKAILAAAQTLASGGLPWWRIAIALATQFGPQIFSLITTLKSLVTKG